MPNQAPLLLKTSTKKGTIRKFIPGNLSKAFQNIARKSQLIIPGFPQLWFLKSVSQNLGTPNAKTQNTKVIGHNTSFPKHQAPSFYPQNQKSYAQNTQTAEHEHRFKPSIKIPFLHQLIHTLSAQLKH